MSLKGSAKCNEKQQLILFWEINSSCWLAPNVAKQFSQGVGGDSNWELKYKVIQMASSRVSPGDARMPRLKTQHSSALRQHHCVANTLHDLYYLQVMRLVSYKMFLSKSQGQQEIAKISTKLSALFLSQFNSTQLKFDEKWYRNKFCLISLELLCLHSWDEIPRDKNVKYSLNYNR